MLTRPLIRASAELYGHCFHATASRPTLTTTHKFLTRTMFPATTRTIMTVPTKVTKATTTTIPGSANKTMITTHRAVMTATETTKTTNIINKSITTSNGSVTTPAQQQQQRFITTHSSQQQQTQPQTLQEPQVELAVHPRICQHDVHTSIGAEGLNPGEKVTFKLTTQDHRGVPFTSTAHYTADKHGVVDVDSFISSGGSYTGVFPAGLITTLEPPVTVKHEYKRMTPVDTSKPWKMDLSIHSGHVDEAECGDDPVAIVELERHLRGPGVERVEVESGRVRGALYLPPGPGPHPAVIDMFGAAGGIMEHRAAMLASRGFICLSLPFFGYKDLPRSLSVMEMEYFEEAVEFLLSTPTAIPDRCGVMSTCQGGATGLAMGIWIDKVKAVFAINASTCLYETTLLKDGKPLALGYNMASRDLIWDDRDRGCLNLETSGEFLNVDSKYSMPVEKASSDTELFFVSGEKCSFLAKHSMELYKQRMDAHGKTNYQTKCYAGAGHFIEPPYGPFIYKSYQQYWPFKDDTHRGPEKGVFLRWGGTAQGACQAQVQMWQDAQNFFLREIQGKSAFYQNYILDKHRQNKS